MNIQDIIFRECPSNTEINLYEENGRWYAYSHSAVKVIKKETRNTIIDSSEISIFGMLLPKIEVDLQAILDNNWHVELCSDHKITLV